jgi:hypothetical protein
MMKLKKTIYYNKTILLDKTTQPFSKSLNFTQILNWKIIFDQTNELSTGENSWIQLDD